MGPEAPLVLGVADELRHAGIAVFGPGREAARIEGSKGFAKDVMAAAAVPTAERLAVARPPCVIKADGLAAGKGVFVCRTPEQLDAGLRAAAAFPGLLVIEELLEGDEVSLFGLSDGRTVVPLAPAQDFKRTGDGTRGRTPAAWARSRRCRCSPRTRRRNCSTWCTGRWSPSSPGAGRRSWGCSSRG